MARTPEPESVGGGGARVWRGRGRAPRAVLPDDVRYDAPLTDDEQGGPPRRRVHAWEIHQERLAAERAEELSLLRQVTQSLGGIFSSLTDAPIDDVLFAGSIIIGPPGATDAYEQLDFKQATAFVAIFNYQSVPLWLIEGGFTGGAPGPGAGRFQIQPGEARGVPLRGTSVTVWIGTAIESGPTCDLAVYARGGAPFSAVIA